MNSDQLRYSLKVIPGVLSIVSNVEKIPSLPFINRFVIDEATLAETPLTVGYCVSDEACSKGPIKGKSYAQVDDNTVRLETPIGAFGRLSLMLCWDAKRPVIVVNKTYHRLGRMTLGNAHSIPWLLRDLINHLLLHNNMALLHAAALRYGNRVVVIFGLSNTGKTKTVFSLVRERRVQFYGDDLIVTDGHNVIACPYTATNVDPGEGLGVLYGAQQWMRRTLPFFENVRGTFGLSLCDSLGSQFLSGEAPATDVILMRRGSQCSMVTVAGREIEISLLASNRTEFTYMSSPVFSAAEFYGCNIDVREAIRTEERILTTLAGSARCHDAQGDYRFLREQVRLLLGIEG